jgi:alpha-glucosidase
LLQGKIGQYTILARRSGANWFVGATTNNTARKFELSTDFLKQGKYHITLIEDGINANTRAEDYKMKAFDFTSGETLKINLAKGGGWIARITPVN